MPFLLKDPAAAIDYAVDWGAEYLEGDAIAASEWTIEPAEPEGLRIDGETLEEGTASVTLLGGEPGKIYRAVNQIVTVGGFRDRRAITIRVEKR